MSADGDRTVRIAHAYGNRREKIDEAIAADVDAIEADVWFRAGEFWVRHERRLGLLPLLYDRRPRGVDSIGPWALTIFPRHYVRIDLQPLRLRELLERTEGKRRLLIDIKDDHPEEDARVSAAALVRLLAEAGAEGSSIICGQTDVLDSVREAGPHLDVRYSIERRPQWETLLRRLDAGVSVRGLCVDHRFFDDAVAGFTRENGLEVYCWTVDDAEEARRLVQMGARGIISNRLPLLEGL